MAHARMPDAFFDIAVHHLPPEQPVGPRGGRPGVSHYLVLRLLWFVLATGCRWEDVPPELGCSGMTAHRCLRRWEEMGCWDRLHADLLRLLRQADKLDPDLVIVDGVMVRAFGGGEQTGPSPVDRRKRGSKHTLLVDRHGVPLAIHTAPANASDHRQIIPLVLDFPKVKGKPGRPKELPDALYADRGYDSDSTRWLLAWLGIEPHIARRRTPHGSGLGKVRWVVERTISWLKGLRRLRIRYDRLGVMQDAWDTLAACVICFRLLHDDSVLE
jgi:transposase